MAHARIHRFACSPGHLDPHTRTAHNPHRRCLVLPLAGRLHRQRCRVVHLPTSVPDSPRGCTERFASSFVGPGALVRRHDRPQELPCAALGSDRDRSRGGFRHRSSRPRGCRVQGGPDRRRYCGSLPELLDQRRAGSFRDAGPLTDRRRDPRVFQAVAKAHCPKGDRLGRPLWTDGPDPSGTGPADPSHYRAALSPDPRNNSSETARVRPCRDRGGRCGHGAVAGLQLVPLHRPHVFLERLRHDARNVELRFRVPQVCGL